MNCTHKTYNPECQTCRNILDYAGWAFKHGLTDYCDPVADWEGMVEYWDARHDEDLDEDLFDEEEDAHEQWDEEEEHRHQEEAQRAEDISLYQDR